MSLKRILFSVSFSVFSFSAGAEIQSPETFIGHRIGADYKVEGWKKICDYFAYIDENSNRVTVEKVGETTEGKPFIIVEISSPETISRIDDFKAIQRKIADPRAISGQDEKNKLIRDSKTVVLVNCNLHSPEIASSQMSMELVYDLATGNSPEIKEILEKTIIVLVPSANPDGLDMVVDWYYRSLGKPWEGGNMPWLYQKYAGHDNNRDWFMLNLQETRVLTHVLYKEWFPHILYDIHQMNSFGPRLFLPPFTEPKNPNVDAINEYMLLILGGHMSVELSRAGKTGLLHDSGFDNWWEGGVRTTAYRHNMMGILSEAASVRVATPMFITKNDLRGAVTEFPDYTDTKFPDPWPGGWWRLRDIVEYEKIACMSLFTLSARYHDLFTSNYIKLGEDAIAKGANQPPYAWLIPPDQRDQRAVYDMLLNLDATGVEIHQAKEPFNADNIYYPAGTYILYCSQPYRAHLNDLMECQTYPERFQFPGGPAIPPYDIAGWTMPLQMGVYRAQAIAPFKCKAEKLDKISLPEPLIKGNGAGGYIVKASSNDDFRLMNRFAKEKIEFSIVNSPETFAKETGVKAPAGSIYIPSKISPKDLSSVAKGLSTIFQRIDKGKPENSTSTFRIPRTGLYQQWIQNAEEGWTRFILDSHEFAYTTIHNDDIKAGNLGNRYECIVIPAATTASIMNGAEPQTTEPRYTGGIGKEGVVALQQFVIDGGTLVCMDASCNFGIEKFNLPVKNILTGKKTDEFYCPGSIVRIWNDTNNPICWGMPQWCSAYFRASQAFAMTPAAKDATPVNASVKIVSRYSDSTLLESGWMNGENLVKGSSSILEASYGKGKIILIGFNVQNRGQSQGTFRIFFNSIIHSGINF